MRYIENEHEPLFLVAEDEDLNTSETTSEELKALMEEAGEELSLLIGENALVQFGWTVSENAEKFPAIRFATANGETIAIMGMAPPDADFLTSNIVN